ncbi:transposase [Salicibibacter cibi]|uniref:Transposase n=1 Tax=Salicibibacter cibi TaxID=2743001 RepID=A0A7T7CE16_9BACI|nr:RNA-guided endonuclease TnpB family protein [Salicibibacter cibi]QQK78530.1 transposase [Salicibibacter cibi]
MSHIAYKFKIEPDEMQKETILQTLSLCRWLYNTALEQRIYEYKTHKQALSLYTQKKELPQLKQAFPVYKSVHSQVLQNVIERLDKAYQSFFNRLKKEEKAGFPRFKGKKRYHSFVYPQSGFSLKGKYIFLSKIGDVRIKKHREVRGDVKACTVIHKNGKFHVSLLCEIEPQENPMTDKAKKPKAIGIDLGISHLAITSDGYFF